MKPWPMTTYTPKPMMRDSRYQVRPEDTEIEPGRFQYRYVARFFGEIIGYDEDRGRAWDICEKHHLKTTK